MKYIIIILVTLVTLVLLAFLPAFTQENPHISIVYPKNNSTISAPSTFLVGNTKPKSTLTINDRKVKVHENGGFVEVVSLNKGSNQIFIKSSLNDKQSVLLYNLTRSNTLKTQAYPQIKRYSHPLSGEVVTNYAVIRDNSNGTRLTPMLSGTKIKLIAKCKDDYKFRMGNNATAWISAKDIKLLNGKKTTKVNTIKSVKAVSTPDSTIINITMTDKLPISITQISKPRMTLNIYGAKAAPKVLRYLYNDNFISNLKIFQPYNDIFKIVISPNANKFWGYSYYYEGNTLVLKLRKTPQINQDKLLNGKIITIDAGHGGSEYGSIGPTEIPEKDINLSIAQFLREKLENAGAKVIMTRNSDEYVDLYKRVDIANANNSQLLLSIHNNALPDGKNPYVAHGSSTYYYHPQSLPLAKSIQSSLIQTLGFKDYGIYSRSLVLTRPNELLAVLIEVGFMIYPDEYNLLIQKDFQEKAADAIFAGVENYFRENSRLDKKY